MPELYGQPAIASRNEALDGLRGWAALAVVFFHAILHLDNALIDRVLVPGLPTLAMQDLPAKLALTLFNGNGAVQLFYVISGAVLGRSLLRTRMQGADVLAFLVRRVLRLLPALAACLVFMLLLSRAHTAAGLAGFPDITAKAALLNALLIDTRVHGPSTTIQIEAMAVPFLVAAAWSISRRGALAAWFWLVFGLCAVTIPALVFRLPNLHGALGAFMVGVLVALPQMAEVFRRATAGWIIAALIGAIGLRAYGNLNDLVLAMAQWLLFGAAVGLVWHADMPTAAHRFLLRPFSQLLGRVSYSFYLLCLPIQFLLWFSPLLSWFGKSAHPLEVGILSGLVAAVVTLPLAYASYRWIERPGIDLGVRLTRALHERRLSQVPA